MDGEFGPSQGNRMEKRQAFMFAEVKYNRGRL